MMKDPFGKSNNTLAIKTKKIFSAQKLDYILLTAILGTMFLSFVFSVVALKISLETSLACTKDSFRSFSSSGFQSNSGGAQDRRGSYVSSVVETVG